MSNSSWERRNILARFRGPLKCNKSWPECAFLAYFFIWEERLKKPSSNPTTAHDWSDCFFFSALTYWVLKLTNRIVVSTATTTTACDNVNNFSPSLLHHFHFTRKPEILMSTWPICEKKIQKAAAVPLKCKLFRVFTDCVKTLSVTQFLHTRMG